MRKVKPQKTRLCEVDYSCAEAISIEEICKGDCFVVPMTRCLITVIATGRLYTLRRLASAGRRRAIFFILDNKEANNQGLELMSD